MLAQFWFKGWFPIVLDIKTNAGWACWSNTQNLVQAKDILERIHIPWNTSNPSLPFNLAALKQLYVINPRDLEKKNLKFTLHFFPHSSLSATLHSSVFYFSLNFRIFKKSLSHCCRYHYRAKPPSSHGPSLKPITIAPPTSHCCGLSLPQRSINPCYAFACSTA